MLGTRESKVLLAVTVGFALMWSRQDNADDEKKLNEKTEVGGLHKRCRIVFDGVVLPTLAAVRRRQAEEAKEGAYNKLALLKNVRTLPCIIIEQNATNAHAAQYEEAR